MCHATRLESHFMLPRPDASRCRDSSTLTVSTSFLTVNSSSLLIIKPDASKVSDHIHLVRPNGHFSVLTLFAFQWNSAPLNTLCFPRRLPFCLRISPPGGPPLPPPDPSWFRLLALLPSPQLLQVGTAQNPVLSSLLSSLRRYHSLDTTYVLMVPNWIFTALTFALNKQTNKH